MNKLLLFFFLVTFISCGDAEKKNAATLADTLNLKNKDNVVSVPKDVVKPVPTKMDKYEEKVSDQLEDEFIQKAIIYRRDSALSIFGNIRADYKIFGYQAPDTNSRKLLLISVFTNDVEGNPYRCDYGAYYSSAAIENTRIKYVRSTGNFVEANLIKDHVILTPIFFQKSWVEFKD